MYNFGKQIATFHEDHVRLTNAQRANMRNRRQTNLERIDKGLEELDKPAVIETINQGGYAQKTMTQPPEADQESRYDIDLGVVFEEEDAAGPRTTRGWVRDAIARKATNLKNAPETKKKCVRVIYADGYQCDFPVFRRRWTESGWSYELSSGDEWIVSAPRSMNTWIDQQVSVTSPETSGSYQLRRVIRMGKFFAKIHANRLNRKFPSGLVATALFIEAYVVIDGRDDEAFRETLRAISCRSKYSPVYANGVQVSDDKDIDRIDRLIVEAKTSLEELDKLDDDDATESDARKAWKKVFRHSFFDAVVKETANSVFAPLEKKSVLGGLGLAAPFVASQAAAALSDGERAERMESAVRARNESGGGGKPWSH
ncbi:cyclic GMP-AMP synthase DncV-like nucleotidyltransferase [Aurantimonas marianensis]|uniref:Cyclic GMP-AMP synthase n=1 Tax=Aurantimonas marianensis TaxID=2920428 RepID=A0A9X2H4D8_9HYPH|nr:hypothetical protein [Aurantimonas marianensis]MCP3055057.1 hypothetical protein [Aurantimonas marianensis]